MQHSIGRTALVVLAGIGLATLAAGAEEFEPERVLDSEELPREWREDGQEDRE